MFYSEMFTKAIPVNRSSVEGFDRLVQYHIINSSLGAVCMAINFFLLSIFLGYPLFRKKYQLLILLAVGDGINGLAIILTGLNRVYLYSTALETLTLPVRTPWECAVEVWIIMKLVGDLLLPITTLCMGIERLVAILFPIFFHQRLDGRPINPHSALPFPPRIILSCGTSITFVTVSMCVAFLIAAYKEHDHDSAMYYCGRKAAFGDEFGSFIYSHNIICNLLACTFNLAAYIKARRMVKTQARMRRQLGLIKNYFIISIVSTVLVSLPNAIALFQIYVKDLSNSLSKPAYWAQTANSGIHFFVYLALNSEFRTRVKQLFPKVTGFETRNPEKNQLITNSPNGKVIEQKLSRKSPRSLPPISPVNV